MCDVDQEQAETMRKLMMRSGSENPIHRSLNTQGVFLSQQEIWIQATYRLKNTKDPGSFPYVPLY